MKCCEDPKPNNLSGQLGGMSLFVCFLFVCLFGGGGGGGEASLRN